MNLDNFKKYCEYYADEFDVLTQFLDKKTGGIYRSEGFALCAFSNFCNVDLVIDCGTGAYAKSAEMLCKCFKGKIITIDYHHKYDRKDSLEKKLSIYKNIEMIDGNVYKIIPKILEDHKDDKIGIFFDGPKGKKAYDFILKFIKKFKIKFVGFHDVGICKFTNGDYDFFNNLKEKVLFTDNGWFSKEYNWLNDDRKKAAYPTGPGAVFLYYE